MPARCNSVERKVLKHPDKFPREPRLVWREHELEELDPDIPPFVIHRNYFGGVVEEDDIC